MVVAVIHNPSGTSYIKGLAGSQRENNKFGIRPRQGGEEGEGEIDVATLLLLLLID